MRRPNPRLPSRYSLVHFATLLWQVEEKILKHVHLGTQNCSLIQLLNRNSVFPIDIFRQKNDIRKFSTRSKQKVKNYLSNEQYLNN